MESSDTTAEIVHMREIHICCGDGGKSEGEHTSLRKYWRASSVCRASLDGHSESFCSSKASRSPDMKDIRGHGGVKSISTGGSAGPSASPPHGHQWVIGRVKRP